MKNAILACVAEQYIGSTELPRLRPLRRNDRSRYIGVEIVQNLLASFFVQAVKNARSRENAA